MSDLVPNVLAARYAGSTIRRLWSAEDRVVTERRFWLSVLKAQAHLGIPVPSGVIEAYESVIDDVDLESIRKREAVTRHDVKARIEEFCELAGAEHIHKGLTSRDLTENVEQVLIRDSLRVIRDKSIAVLARLAGLAIEHRTTVVTGRTHNVPAQPTTLGKRFGNAATELLQAHARLTDLLDRYPLRGLKGPVGTQQDLLDLFDGDHERLEALESAVAEDLGFGATMISVGQVYPRSLDLDVVSCLAQIAAGPSSLATTLRLMAGHDLVTEGFREGQVGSSAMPHKMNMRTSERIGGMAIILSGYVTMAAGLAGQQWNEGDVSDSVVRRVMIPDAFFATDGLLEATLTVLDEFGAFEGRIEAELDAELPFLATTRLLMAAVREGVGREEAHAVIQRHTLEAAAARREGKSADLVAALGRDPAYPLDEAATRGLLADRAALVGTGPEQVDRVAAQIGALVAASPEAAAYRPEPLL